MPFTISTSVGLNSAREGYIRITGASSSAGSTHFHFTLSHSDGRTWPMAPVAPGDLQNGGYVQFEGLYNDTYSLSYTDTYDGGTTSLVVSGSVVPNGGPIQIDSIVVDPPTRYSEGSITVQASKGTGALGVYLYATTPDATLNASFRRTVGAPATMPVVLGAGYYPLPRITANTTVQVRVFDRDRSFADAEQSVSIPAYTGCRIAIISASETSGGMMQAYLNDVPASVTEVGYQLRTAGTTAWAAPGKATLIQAGSLRRIEFGPLYNGSYNLQVYYPAGNPAAPPTAASCLAQYGSNATNVIAVTGGANAPDPCDLRIVTLGMPPSRIGLADGKIKVTVTNTQGLQAAAVVSAGAGTTAGVYPAELDPGPNPTTWPNTYFFYVKNLRPGLYDVSARIAGNCSSPTVQVTVPPPALQIGDQLTFLPWVQPLLAHAANGASTGTTAGGPRPSVSLSATLRTDNNPANDDLIDAGSAQVYGPGDVLGINQSALLTVAPAPGSVGFSSQQLAFLDFKEVDLPWRYSTRKLGTAPLPWLMLLVLRDTEFERQSGKGQPLPSINVHGTAGVYPSTEATQQQLWAHVQVNAALPLGSTPAAGAAQQPTPTQVEYFLGHDLPGNPDLAYSRVLCSRRLAPSTHYYAFLVPAVQAGRLAGLGRDYVAADLGLSAIPAAAVGATGPLPDAAFPVYFQWEFTTGSEDDFETLVEGLHQANHLTSAAEAPPLTVATGARTYELPIVGLLLDADAPAPTPTPQDQAALKLAQYLYGQVQPRRSRSGRPLVSAPLYGRSYAATPALQAPRTAVAANWKHQLNLDPRYRALAALGAQVVQDNQEEYVRRAWEQVQDILLANDRLREAQYGLRTTGGLRDQHLPVNITTDTPATGTGRRVAARLLATAATAATAAPTPQTGLADYGLHLTGLALRRVRVSQATHEASAADADNQPRVTVHETIRRSNVPLAAFSPTFRRISKPFGHYLVGEAGRPLRPTQAEDPDTDATDLRTRGTSLRQRDALLTQLSQGTLAAAPDHGEQLRGYQFRDDLVDDFLEASVASADNPTPIVLAAPSLAGTPAGSRLQAALGGVVRQAVNPTTQAVTPLKFRKPQYVRPLLPLALLKQDVVEGTKPGPVFIEKIKVVAPTVGDLPAQVGSGDFLGEHYNASHFYVGDYDEPSHEVGGDWEAADFAAADWLVPHTVWDYETTGGEPDPHQSDPRTGFRTLARGGNAAAANATGTPAATTATTTAAAPATDAELPVIRQAKVFPVFKEPMGEALRKRHPELFVPGLSAFETGGVAVLDVSQAFIEAYMLGLNHALGSELLWRGFPVELRATFFQQFWDVSEYFNATLDPGTSPSPAQEAAQLDITPLDTWGGRELGTNAVNPTLAGTDTLRLAVRSELLRRYPDLVLALQDDTRATTQQPHRHEDPANFRYPTQRLTVGEDLVVVAFGVSLAYAHAHCALVLMERPGQPKFGLDADTTGLPATQDPLSWNDLNWSYAGTALNAHFQPVATGVAGTKPHAVSEPTSVAYLTGSPVVAYALLQEPIMAVTPISNILSV